MNGSAGNEKKRGPRGLANSKQKKRRLSGDEATKDETIALEEGSKTIAISGDVDEDDEVGQLVALYDTAITHLDKGDLETALPIINGTIHEADRILRNNVKDMPLPYNFHWVYASALLDLSTIVNDADAKEGEGVEDYIRTAKERCTDALGTGSGGEGLNRLKLTNANCICRLVQRDLSKDHALNPKTVQPQIEEAIEIFDDAFRAQYYNPLQLHRSLDIIQDYGDSLAEVDEKEHSRINKWAEAKWTKVLTEQQECVSALEGCGRVWLSLAQPKLAELDEAEGLDDKEQETMTESVRTMLETSVELLNQAVKCAEKCNALSGQLLCLLAESTITLANTFDDGPHYEELEASTVKYLKQAQGIEGFQLPERFEDLLATD